MDQTPKRTPDREQRADTHRRQLLSPGASRETLGQLAIHERAREIRKQLLRAGVPEAEARSRAICEAAAGVGGPTMHQLDDTKGATHVTPSTPKRASYPRQQHVRFANRPD